MATNFSRFIQFVSIRSNRVESTTFVTHLTLSRGAISSKSHAHRLPAWRIDNRGNDSCWFDRIESNRQHFQATLHSPPEVKICEIMIHEPSSFLKRGHKLQSIRMIGVDLIESSQIDNILNPPYIVQGRYMFKVSCKSTSGMSNRQKGKRFVSIPWKRVFELISS